MLPLALVVCLVLLLLPCLCRAQDNYAPPVITAIWGCPMSPDNLTITCQQPMPGGPLQMITIAGYNFGLVRGAVVNVSGATWYTQTFNPCTDGRECMLANVPAQPMYGAIGGPGGVLPVNLIQPNSGSASVSNTFYALRMAPISGLSLSSISGCTGSGLTTDGCVLSDAGDNTLTLAGTGFQVDRQPLSLVMPGLGLSYAITTSLVSSSTSLTFPLLAVGAQLSQAIADITLPNGIAVCVLHGVTMSNCLTISVRATSFSALPPAATAFTTSSDLTVTSVSGCPVTTATTTSMCRLPASLTISGSGFVDGNSTAVSVGGVQCEELSVLDEQTLVCDMPNVASAAPIDTWLSVVVMDVASMLQSAPFTGVMYTAPTPIIVTSISGCPGDRPAPSLITSGCDPINGSLTIVGSGFDASYYRWPTYLGFVGSPWDPKGYNDLQEYIVDSRTIVIPFSTLAPSWYTTTQLNATHVLCVVSNEVRGEQPMIGSACPVISFTAPRPVVTSITGCNATSADGLSVTGCQSGQGSVLVDGISLGYPISAMVAGVDAPVVWQWGDLYITLPQIVGLQAGVGYDLVLSNPLYSVTVPGAITFAPSPVISSLTSEYCGPAASTTPVATALLCPVGAVLTIVGSYFSPVDSITVLLYPVQAGVSSNVSCLNVTFDSSNVLTCVLPEPAAGVQTGFASKWVVVVLETGNNETLLSNTVQTALYWNASREPHIDSVTGCMGTDAVTRGVVQCTAGNVITLHGSNFVNSSNTQVPIWFDSTAFICQKPIAVSSSELQCVLPFVLDSTPGDVLPIQIYNMARLQSNWLNAISYLSPNSNPGGDVPAGQGGSGSADSVDSSRLAIVLGVLLPLLVISLLMNVGLLYRYGVCGLGSKKSAAGGGWSTQRDVSDSTQMADWTRGKWAGRQSDELRRMDGMYASSG